MSRQCSKRKQGQRTAEGEARRIKAVTKHGHASTNTQTPEYRAWADIKNRCTNPNITTYQFYGARGITICDRWMSFETFLADMGKRPSKNHSIGRIKNHLGYCHENCRWETREQQDNNRRDNVFVEYGGERMTIAQWARRIGRSVHTLNGRKRRGWSDEQIVCGNHPSARAQRTPKQSLHVPVTRSAEQGLLFR